jgi:hypothetical protein
LKKFILGLIVGLSFAVCTTAFASEIKQYILTMVGYPVVVNGVEFKDANNPILNYEGSTYVPLAKLGDITGVNYKWNDQLKRVEIITKGNTVSNDINPTLPNDKVTLSPGTKVIEPKGIVEENGEKVLYAYDKDGNYKGRFTDEDDAELVIAKIERRTNLPPKLSDGWLGVGLLAKIYNADGNYEGNDYVIKSSPAVMKQEEHFRFPLPEGFKDVKDGQATSKGIQIKMYKGFMYFHIADLQKAGILQ